MKSYLFIMACLFIGIASIYAIDQGEMTWLGWCWFALLVLVAASWLRGSHIRKKHDTVQSVSHPPDPDTAAATTVANLIEDIERQRTMQEPDRATLDGTAQQATAELERRRELALSVADAPLHNLGLNIPIKKTLPPWADLTPTKTPLVIFCGSEVEKNSVRVYVANDHGGWVDLIPEAKPEDTTVTIALPPLVDYLNGLALSVATGNDDLARADIDKAVSGLRQRSARIEVVSRNIRM